MCSQIPYLPFNLINDEEDKVMLDKALLDEEEDREEGDKEMGLWLQNFIGEKKKPVSWFAQ